MDQESLSYEWRFNAMMLIQHMLEAFMAGDRGFRKGRATKAVPLKSS